jgi:sarcosine oxidase, subunit beta
MAEPVDVVIIGAGVIGAATAFELAKRRYRTLNIDKLPSSSYGPTANSCAIVRAHYSTEHGVRMAYAALRYWQRWSEYLGATANNGHLARYVQCGTLLLKSQLGHDQKVLRLYETLGVQYEDWDRDTVARRLPILDMREFWPPSRPSDSRFWNDPPGLLPGGIFTPESGYVSDPALATQNLQEAAEALGARFLFRRTVTDIRQVGGRVRGVTLENGEEIDASVVVNVAGPHSFLINRMAHVEGGMKRTTRPLRHEVHHVAAPDGSDYEHHGVHVSDGDQGIYFRPDVANHILVGSEDPECDSHMWVENPDDFDRSLTRAQWEAQVYRLARRIPELPIPHEMRGVVDLYDCSDDWIPIYDRSDLDGFYMAVGTSGNQFKNAPLVGACMAELIDAVEHGHDHDRTPVTIGAAYSDVEIDLGNYSRLRPVDPASSFSVSG